MFANVFGVWLVAWLSLKVSKLITSRKFQRNFRKSAVTKQLIIHGVRQRIFNPIEMDKKSKDKHIGLSVEAIQLFSFHLL